MIIGIPVYVGRKVKHTRPCQCICLFWIFPFIPLLLMIFLFVFRQRLVLVSSL
jgi:hypothetical protein